MPSHSTAAVRIPSVIYQDPDSYIVEREMGEVVKCPYNEGTTRAFDTTELQCYHRQTTNFDDKVYGACYRKKCEVGEEVLKKFGKEHEKPPARSEDKKASVTHKYTDKEAYEAKKAGDRARNSAITLARQQKCLDYLLSLMSEKSISKYIKRPAKDVAGVKDGVSLKAGHAKRFFSLAKKLGWLEE